MLKKICISLLLLLAVQDIKSVTVISFGEICSAAGALRESGLRTAAYPFDWMISRFDSLYRALEDDFAHFLEENSLHLRRDKQGIVDYYGFEFVHDFPTIKTSISQDPSDDNPITQNRIRDDWREFIPVVREKYLRRIERLKQTLSGSDKIFIFRHFGINRNQAQAIRDLLKRKYPQLDFTLIAVGNSTAMANDWNLSNIRNFYLNDSKVWSNPEEWKKIFQTLGLEASGNRFIEEDDFVCQHYEYHY